ncbi:hypothetical protein ACFSUS_13750 [Spirosoma soli]|uniref:Uncharacterized protein n=1 Tax=Spirosoma soli TaxID=1770529 RepID=A0ABW5M4V6_9BACT
MRRQLIQPYLLTLGVALSLSACFNEPNYSNTPEIDFRTLYHYPLPAQQGVGRGKRDSVVITIGFKDGDGNLGIKLPISKQDSTAFAQNGGWGNYDIKTFRLINRQYVEFPQQVNKFLTFPDLTPDKPRGPIEGTLDFNQTFQYGTSFQLYPTKFQIRIRDESLNVSNVIETDTISLPYPR